MGSGRISPRALDPAGMNRPASRCGKAGRACGPLRLHGRLPPASPSDLLGPGGRRASLEPVARPLTLPLPLRGRGGSKAPSPLLPLSFPLPLGRGRGNPGRGRWPFFLPPPALRGEGRGEGPRDPAHSARRARLRQEKASQRTKPAPSRKPAGSGFQLFSFSVFQLLLVAPPTERGGVPLQNTRSPRRGLTSTRST